MQCSRALTGAVGTNRTSLHCTTTDQEMQNLILISIRHLYGCLSLTVLHVFVYSLVKPVAMLCSPPLNLLKHLVSSSHCGFHRLHVVEHAVTAISQLATHNSQLCPTHCAACKTNSNLSYAHWALPLLVPQKAHMVTSRQPVQSLISICSQLKIASTQFYIEDAQANGLVVQDRWFASPTLLRNQEKGRNQKISVH